MSVPANFFDTYAVVASPTDDAETVIGILGGVNGLLPALGIHLSAAAQILWGADTTESILRIRRGSLTGDQVGEDWTSGEATGGLTVGAPVVIEALDQIGDFAGAVYVLTAEMADASAAATVAALGFHARVD